MLHEARGHDRGAFRYACPTLHATLRHEGAKHNRQGAHWIHGDERLRDHTKRREQPTCKAMLSGLAVR